MLRIAATVAVSLACWLGAAAPATAGCKLRADKGTEVVLWRSIEDMETCQQEIDANHKPGPLCREGIVVSVAVGTNVTPYLETKGWIDIYARLRVLSGPHAGAG